MKRQVFYSFHYEQDSRRAAQIRTIGVIEGNTPASDNEWETIKRGGDDAIRYWINTNLQYRSCLIVLIGQHTSERRWVNYEIIQAWNKGMGVLGIYIHNINNPLLCKLGYSGKSYMGENPFGKIYFENGRSLSSVVKCYNPNPYDACKDIANNVEIWIEQAIQQRR